ncbi:hypothetical protein Htur_0797 [Haloterrigena turkmenica DSM 5511]|uniref:Uncharacterized protein n=1 Tax=Haloterrigena turkmenica (strain ATCC 51198 / DSM 5511 / JCM 9101 / NCIMB 13204 / VKM B-1734 / 4k) TaxID=543526 RepID=D2RX81_HALTV|nr:hypothetical protein [Haloterrigena turkmenica]ADB59693.1 hypothetical protein Htur_0797 [Haloterrigena turkmenica DSM 5511]
MDATQIALGVALLLFGTLTLAGPATFVSGPFVYVLTGAMLLVTGYALLVGLWKGRSDRS